MLFLAYQQHRLDGIAPPGISHSLIDIAKSIELLEAAKVEKAFPVESDQHGDEDLWH